MRRGSAQRRLLLEDFYLDYMKNALQPGEFVQAIEVPPPAFTALRAYKLSKRFDCDISALAAGLAITLDGEQVREARFAFGGMAAIVKRAARAEAAVRGRPWSEATLQAAMAALAQDFTPLTDLRASASYRQRAAGNLLRRFWLETRNTAPLLGGAVHGLGAGDCDTMNQQAEAVVIAAAAEAEALAAGARVGISRPHESAHLHVAGEATYIDDITELSGTLHAALGLSPLAHGRLLAIDVAGLRALPGVLAVLTAADIPGSNDCGPIVHGDDPILASDVVHYLGQPMFAVIAADRRVARRVAARAKEFVRIEPLPALLTAREAHAAKAYVVPPMHLARGDALAAMAKAPHRFKDSLSVGGQEQFYLEGQISYAIPLEDDGLLVHCSTQHPSEMQHLVAHALGLASHQVQVQCRRMGGGFGGKESQSALFACVAALAASKLGVPVKLRLDRDDDFMATGRRHGFEFDFEVGYDDEGRVLGVSHRSDRQRRLLGRPVAAGDDARDLPLRQRLLAARGGHARLLRPHQHAEQHRVSRLRRAAGRDRDRVHHGQHRAPPGPRPARRAARQLLRHDGPQRHALRPDGRRQHPRAADRSPAGHQRLPRAPRARSRPGTRPARCSSAASR